jgi:hypothetical protein
LAGLTDLPVAPGQGRGALSSECQSL